MKKTILFIFILSLGVSQVESQYIDGVTAIIEDHIILKSDLAQMVNMAAIQNRIDPRTNPDVFIQLQNSVVQSMVDQKIMLEMAAIDSITVTEKEVNQALDQQIQMLIAQAGGEKSAEAMLGQPIKEFRREYWFDMQDKMISERYQQQLLSTIAVTRNDVIDFYKTYRDSLPSLPMKVKVRHLLIPVHPSNIAKENAINLLKELRSQINQGADFGELAKLHSMDPGSKNNGGELGWVNRGSLVKNFETVAFTQDIGVLSQPVETEFGYHILETLEKHGDKIRIRHILIKPEITQKDQEIAFKFGTVLKDSISTLEEFKMMVEKYSTDGTTNDIGGDLGWIDPTNYSVPEIGQAIKYLELNQCSPPINSSIGFHLLWIDGLKKGGRPNLIDHWPDVENMALNKKKMDWYQDWINKARQRFYIQIN